MPANPNNFKAEVICNAPDCASHFEFDPSWTTTGGTPGHFHHWLLAAVPPGGRLPVTICPCCGERGHVVEKRRVPSRYRFALGDTTIAPALAAAVSDDGPHLSVHEDKTPSLRRQLRAQLQRAGALHLTGQFNDDEDGRLNTRIVADEELLQHHPGDRQRILSFWALPEALKHLDSYGGLYVLTEAGRHATTFAFREEY